MALCDPGRQALVSASDDRSAGLPPAALSGRNLTSDNVEVLASKAGRDRRSEPLSYLTELKTPAHRSLRRARRPHSPSRRLRSTVECPTSPHVFAERERRRQSLSKCCRALNGTDRSARPQWRCERDPPNAVSPSTAIDAGSGVPRNRFRTSRRSERTHVSTRRRRSRGAVLHGASRAICASSDRRLLFLRAKPSQRVE